MDLIDCSVFLSFLPLRIHSLQGCLVAVPWAGQQTRLKKRPSVLDTHLTPVGALSKQVLVFSILMVAVDRVGCICILMFLTLLVDALVSMDLSTVLSVGEMARRMTSSRGTV